MQDNMVAQQLMTQYNTIAKQHNKGITWNK